ncbi:MAG: translocation/assembly module TamB domain-containing protein [Ferrimonas sp.]
MIRNLLLALVSLCLLALIAIAFIIGTPVGTRWFIDGLNKLPMLTLEYQSGQFNRGIELSKADIQLAPESHISLEQLQFQWRPRCLWQHQLCIEHIRVEQIQVRLPEPEASNEPAPSNDEPFTFQLPIRIALGHSYIKQLDVQIGEQHIQLEHLHTELTLDSERLVLGDTLVRGLVYQATFTEEEDAASTAPELQTEGTAAPATAEAAETPLAEQENLLLLGRLAEAPLAQLPHLALPLEVIIERFEIADVQLDINGQQHSLTRLIVAGEWVEQHLKLATLELDHPWLTLGGDLTLSLVGDYPWHGTLQGHIGALPSAWELADLDGSHYQIAISQSLGHPALDVTLDGSLQASLNARVDLQQPTLPYHIELQAAQLHWPLVGTPEYQARQLRLESSGDLAQQRLDGKLRVLVEGLPQSQLTLKASQKLGHIALDKLQLDGGLGTLALAGQVDLTDGVAWQVNLDVPQLDLSPILPDMALTLAGSLATKGQLRSVDDWQIELTQADLTGQWQAYPLALQGQLALDHLYQGQANHLRAEFNGASLTLNGGLNKKRWQLEGQLQNLDLHRFDPSVRGRINGQLSVTGPATNPQVTASLNSRRMGLHEAGIDTVVAEHTAINLQYQPEQNHKMHLSVASKLSTAEMDIGKLTTELSGDLTDQHWQLALTGAQNLALDLRGRYQAQQARWQGQLNQLKWHHLTSFVELQEATNINVDLQRERAIITPHCWLLHGGEICSEQPATVGRQGDVAWQLAINVGQLLAPVLPERLAIDSHLRGRIAANWSPTQGPNVELQLQDNNGNITLHHNFGLEPSTINWESVQARVQLDDQQVLLHNQFQLRPGQYLDLSLAVGRQAPYPLSGKLGAHELNLEAILAWIPALAEGQIQLDSDLQISGTVQQPLLNGHVTLSEGRLLTLVSPTLVDDLTLVMDFVGTQAQFRGNSLIGDGATQIDGQFLWQDGLSAKAQIRGKELQLLYPPMVTLQASTDLNLSWTPELLNLTGNIHVEEGAIVVADLPQGAVQVSDDVVFVDIPEQERAPNQKTHLDLNVNVAPTVAVQAFGLSGLVGGDLSVQQHPGRPLQLFGSVGLHDAFFEVFGQRLAISRGQASFNGPAGNPTLDVEAIREITSEDLTVGVRVTGLSSAPQMQLFADEGMEQQEILSYLVRGQGLNSDGNSAMWASAALSLGVGSTGGVITAVGDQLGLRDLKLDAEGSGDDTQLTVSTYIGDRLYIKYGMEVFGEGLSQLTVRYYLLKRLWLESLSAVSEDSNNRSFDIYYSFEIP